jgi:murein DD-endopeptidase MepM/ murein hydrolase activator NlpD
MFVTADERSNGQAAGRLPYPVVPGFERFAPDSLDMVREVTVTVGDNCFFGNHAGSLDALFDGRAVSIDYSFESFDVLSGDEPFDDSAHWFQPGYDDAPLCPLRNLAIKAVGRWSNPKDFKAVKIILPKDKIEALRELEAGGDSSQGAPGASSDTWDFPVTPYVPGSYGGRGFYYDKNHLGEDERLAEGTAVHAIGPGKVVYYGPAPSYGELVAAVEHDLGTPRDLISGVGTPVKTAKIISVYGHIRPCDKREQGECTGLSVGSQVTKDTIIGYVNDHNDDPALDHNGDGKEHLHLGIRLASAEQAQEADGAKWLRGYESGSKNVGQFAAGSALIPRFQTLLKKPPPQQEQLIGADGAWRIGITGFGPIEYSMDVGEVSKRIGISIENDTESPDNCFFAELREPHNPAGVFFKDQHVAEVVGVSASNRIRTSSGIQIGSSIQDVDSAYRGHSGLERRVHRDRGNSHSVVFWNRSKKRGLRFDLDESGHVIAFRGGTKSIWEYEPWAAASCGPQWIRRLTTSSIVPDVGLAGISLGNAEDTVLRQLGHPLRGPSPVTDMNGNILDYVLNFEFKGVSLVIGTSRDQRTVDGIRLFDKEFNRRGYIPRIKNITIGSTGAELVNAFGQPTSKDEHFTCPGHNHRATTFKYPGVSFWVCEANGLIYLIDIP